MAELYTHVTIPGKSHVGFSFWGRIKSSAARERFRDLWAHRLEEAKRINEWLDSNDPDVTWRRGSKKVGGPKDDA